MCYIVLLTYHTLSVSSGFSVSLERSYLNLNPLLMNSEGPKESLMNRRITRALVALITSFAISVAHADRRTSLGGNMLIPDRDDVFVYPQLAVKNKCNHSASIDFGNAAGVGNALLTAGPDKKSAIGVALHRSDSILSIGGGFYNGSPEFGMVGNNIVPLTSQAVTPQLLLISPISSMR